MEEKEIRVGNIELRMQEEVTKITGYASVFNEWTDIGGWFREQIAPGAFQEAIKKDDVRALLNHDSNYVLGRNTAKTLTLKEDEKGLFVEIVPPKTQWARDLEESIRRGDINQMSFGFMPITEDYNSVEKERIIRKAKLFDVSIVTFPAYPTTTAQVRAKFENKNTEKKEEVKQVLHGKWKNKTY